MAPYESIIIIIIVVVVVVDRDWEDMKKMPEHQTLVKDFKKIKYEAALLFVFIHVAF